jgi:hypothetical protein
MVIIAMYDAVTGIDDAQGREREHALAPAAIGYHRTMTNRHEIVWDELHGVD